MDEMYRLATAWFLRLKYWKKLAVLIIFLFTSVALIRIGIFGDAARKFTIRVVEGTIPFLDEEKPHLALYFVVKTTRCGDDVFEIRNNGVVLSTRDRIALTVNTSADAYIAVLGNDKLGVYSLYPEIIPTEKFNRIKVNKVSKDINYSINFDHDEVEGWETIYLLASQASFEGLSPITVLSEIEQTEQKGPSFDSASLHSGEIKVKKFSFRVSADQKNCT